jgi:hypothetical protein
MTNSGLEEVVAVPEKLELGIGGIMKSSTQSASVSGVSRMTVQ